jgi:hypothetical protein
MKQIQDAIDMEKAQQALVQKRHYLFDVQRVGFCGGTFSVLPVIEIIHGSLDLLQGQPPT